MSGPFPPIDRRTTLAWFGAAMTMPAFAVPLDHSSATTVAAGAELKLTGTTPGGYGFDPDLNDPTAPWPRIMTQIQKRQVGVLADIVLPKTPEYPAPSEVGIPDFMDEWISAPYPDQLADRLLFSKGLDWIEAESQRRWKTGFLSLNGEQQTGLLETLSTPPPEPASGEAADLHSFFRRLRSLVVGSYFSLASNFAQLGYIGNVAQESFPPATAEENAFIDHAISTLHL